MVTRELKCEFGKLSRADGSALLCQGRTKVLAGIYGPVVRIRDKMSNDRAAVECQYTPKAKVPDYSDRTHEHLIKYKCENVLPVSLHPRTSILVTVQELHNSGKVVACAINASCLACLDSGVELKSPFAAVTCALTKRDKLAFKIPVHEKDRKGLFLVVYNETKDVLDSYTWGYYDKTQYDKAMEMCREESEKVFNFYKKVTAKRFKKK